MKKKIAILLATYNSSLFLEEQLDSLFNQNYLEWQLYIRDDGSKDNTQEIIQVYKSRYDNITIVDDGDSGVGALNSFMKLLKNVDADYYFFCDHDDIWERDKISKSLKLMIDIEKINPNKPIIVHTDLKVVDRQLNITSNSFWKSSGIKPKLLENERFIQVFNCVTGCTMLLNKKSKDISFPYPTSAPMHDWWIAIQTLRCKGIIHHLNDSTILYRQHGGNEVGARSVNFNYFFNKIKTLKQTLHGHKVHIAFLKEIDGLNALQYYYYKLIYTIVRKL